MAQVKVTHRTYNISTGRHDYTNVGVFKSYKDAVEYFNGTQTWYEKKDHCFRVGNELYLMSK